MIKISPLSTASFVKNRNPLQRMGATVVGINKSTNTLLVEIGKDAHAPNDLRAIKTLYRRLNTYRMSNPYLKDSISHLYFSYILNWLHAPKNKYFADKTKILTMNNETSKIMGGICYTENTPSIIVDYLSSLKSGGGDLLAFLCKKLEDNSATSLDLFSMEHEEIPSLICKNGRQVPEYTALFYKTFGFPYQPKGGWINLSKKALTPYAKERMANVQTTNLPTSFPLPQDLGIGDGNVLWDKIYSKTPVGIYS